MTEKPGDRECTYVYAWAARGSPQSWLRCHWTRKKHPKPSGHKYGEPVRAGQSAGATRQPNDHDCGGVVGTRRGHCDATSSRFESGPQ